MAHVGADVLMAGGGSSGTGAASGTTSGRASARSSADGGCGSGVPASDSGRSSRTGEGDRGLAGESSRGNRLEAEAGPGPNGGCGVGTGGPGADSGDGVLPGGGGDGDGSGRGSAGGDGGAHGGDVLLAGLPAELLLELLRSEDLVAECVSGKGPGGGRALQQGGITYRGHELGCVSGGPGVLLTARGKTESLVIDSFVLRTQGWCTAKMSYMRAGARHLRLCPAGGRRAAVRPGLAGGRPWGGDRGGRRGSSSSNS